MRITATFLISAALATIASTALAVVTMDSAWGAPRIVAEVAPAVCSVEAAAYLEVSDLAHMYRDSGDVFADALYDLREQLLDCLATSGDMPEDGMSMPSRDDGRSI
ncbi:hypothetical protein [Neorhizobium alkalisoli]|uniref:UrcA family protein n=1 Tax=Neorhizobium alkalisoli TaxID=528178 RepID=A0A561R8N1_9HYPH|nr:hypothetical protein [Neorhizobium alkalisoli]TWF58966.1 hypothetical protein FHW37_101770 [Neorhizobium alkalisoli]